MWEESQAENARLRLEINTVRFDLEIARQQLAAVKVESCSEIFNITTVLGGDGEKSGENICGQQNC